MEIKTKEDITNFIESHLKELGGEAFGVNYISEKLFEWHESQMKSLPTPEERREQLNTLNEKPYVSDFVISLTLKDITKIVNAFSDFNIPVEAVKEEIELTQTK